jgi:hypothetical protein
MPMRKLILTRDCDSFSNSQEIKGASRVGASEAKLRDVLARGATSVAVGLPLVLAFVSLTRWLSIQAARLVWEGDGAILELYTLQATRGIQLTGPYSRFGWHHPGPLYFYILAPLYQLTGHNSVSLQLSSLLIALSAFAGLLAVAYRSTAPAVYFVTASLVPAYIAAFGVGFFATPWNPYVTVAPYAVSLFVWVAFCTGGAWALPVAVAISSFVVQTHISYGPMVVGATATAFLVAEVGPIRTILRLPRAPIYIGPGCVATTLLLTVALWTPTIVEQMIDSPGNVTLLLQYFFSTDHQVHGLAESYRLLSQLLPGPALLPWRILGIDPAQVLQGHLLEIATLGQVVLLHAALFVAIRRRLGYRTALCAIATSQFWIALWATTHIDGTLLPYLVAWSSGLGLIQWIAIGSVVGPAIVERVNPSPKWRWAIAPAVVGLATLISLGYSLPQSVISPRMSASDSAPYLQLAGDLAGYEADMAVGPALVKVDDAAWPQAAAIVLQMAKDKIAFHVEPDWLPMFGEPLAPSGTERLTAYITTTGGLVPGPGEWDIVTRDSTNVIWAQLDPVVAVTRPGSKWNHRAYAVRNDVVFTEATLDHPVVQPGEPPA